MSIPHLKFECPVCHGTKFIFTRFSDDKNIPHGAKCAACGAQLSIKSCITKSEGWLKKSFSELF